MKIVGIIAEYNPFHNGHLHQLNRAKELSDANYTVAVMSGSFVQRGEPAICNKWARSKMALSCGVDLVIELPTVYCAQSAEYFATGGVRLLDSIGADYISFGAEDDKIANLKAAAEVLVNESDEFRAFLANSLKDGKSFPAAREEAASKFGVSSVLYSPNNILAVEYIKALLKSKSNIIPIPVKRIGCGHDKLGSASYIRNNMSKCDEYMPNIAHELLQQEINNKRAPVTFKSLDNGVMAHLRSIPINQLAEISGVAEGIENRIKRAAIYHTTVEEVISCVKTRRYTYSRIRRIIINSLIGITNAEITKPPEYIRILGLNDRGREMLNKIKKTAKIPIITKVADANITQMLTYDILATNLYSLMYPDTDQRKGNLDYINSPIIV
ncbi:MAG: nucleotidyltransferase [Clostridiaceae bacterium]|nr:nucleotidyltransferase [Clostridiaceae bacterium]